MRETRPANYLHIKPQLNSKYDHTDTKPALILWFFDSRGGFGPGPTADSNPNPDWVDATVATWINETRAAMDEKWGDAGAVGRGSLAFVHIPP